MGLLLRDLITMGENLLKEEGIPDSEHDARALMESALCFTKSDIFMNWSNEIDDLRIDTYMEAVDRRRNREPLQYITGVQNFMGIDFMVNENVLIPRQDTERLVENVQLVIKNRNTKASVNTESEHVYERVLAKKHWHILDLCTGSGCIGISVAKNCDNVKKVVMSDISMEALKVARENAKNAGVEKKVEFVKSDLFDSFKKREKFDMIISNPPYIRSEVIPTLMEEVKDHEPMSALDGGADGLDFYRKIISEAPERLEKSGILALEIGHDQAEEVVKLLDETKRFGKAEVIKDYGGNERAVLVVLK